MTNRTLLNDETIQQQLKSLDGWKLEGSVIRRQIKFDDFTSAFSAMTQIAMKAEKMNHHPDWSNVYNQLDIKLNTHDAGGITGMDMELAKQINQVLKMHNTE